MAKKKSVMAKHKTNASTPASGTPVCIAALYCDTAFITPDTSVTIVRTIDTITLPPGTSFKLGEPVELVAQSRLVLMLKRDDAIGRHEMPLVQIGPKGKTDPVGLIVQDFPKDADPATGYNFVGAIRFIWRGDGLYWIQVKTKTGKVIARTALRLKIAPQPTKD